MENEVPEPNNSDSARNVLLAGIAILNLHGEADLRVLDVARIAGVSVGTIYSHFNSRDGLIKAARVEQYRECLSGELSVFSSSLESANTVDEVLAAILLFCGSDGNVSGLAARWMRLEVLGSARRRPHLAAALAEENMLHIDRGAKSIQMVQQRGLIDPKVDPQALMAMFDSWSTGSVNMDLLAGTLADQKQWVALADKVLRSAVLKR